MKKLIIICYFFVLTINGYAQPIYFQAAILEGASDASAAWGDYDSDGDLDLIYNGTFTKLYRNDDGVFTDTGIVFSDTWSGDTDWADYDSDGDLDVVISGNTGLHPGSVIIHINNGDDTFTPSSINPLSGQSSSTEWVDYDNDGDLDLFYCGTYATGSPSSFIEMNNNGEFTFGGGIVGFYAAGVDWGDFDNDKDQDLLISGLTEAGEVTTIYGNDGGNLINLSPFGIGVQTGDAEWGDYDADGDLDVALSGWNGTQPVFQIFRNNGDGSFTDVSDFASGLRGLVESSIDWGDFDNDGDLDVLITGSDETDYFTLIYEYIGSDIFDERDFGMIGVRDGDGIFGDYNNDGDLDVFIVGEDGLGIDIAVVYSYQDLSAILNNPPPAPINLSSVVTGTEVTFSWIHDTSTIDDYTPENGLSYNLRIGTISGSADIMTAMTLTPTNGLRVLPDLGNVGSNKSWTIKGLSSGTYFWSVQAIDGSYKGGNFATEQSFTIQGAASITSYSNNFNTTSNDFTGNGYTMETPEGFTNGAIHSLHPYEEAGTDSEIHYNYQLNTPIIVSATNSTVTFDEVVLVEPGDPGSVFGVEEFWDYVIAEVSKDNGVTWIPLLDGYDADADVDWQSHYDSSFDANNNSTAVGNETLFKTRTLSLTDGAGVNPGDEVLFRFRMFSDPFTVGWGWAIDNLQIQSTTTAGGDIQADSLALVALYNATAGANWSDNTNWLSGPVSTWYGITVQSNRVFSIDLVANNLIGSIPPEIGDLSALDSLFLFSNDFTLKTIPSELGNLTNLKELSLYDTGIGGDIPTSLGNLTQLSLLSLSSNELTGTIPAFLGNLTELTDLYLWGNNFTGEIPAELGNLVNMDWLNLSTNDLSGSLPTSLGNLTNMTYFSVTNNVLTGDIPSSFSNLTNLETLALGGNDFTGTIPLFIGTMTNLTGLYLWGNQFTGNIPAELSSLTGLVDLYLGSNQFDGPVPNYLNTFVNLEDVSVHSNNFESMPDLSAITSITVLEVENNKLTFEDIVPNLGIAFETYTYSPQQTAGAIQTIEVPQGSDYTIDLGFDAAVSGSNYEWFFGATSIGTSTTPTFTITDFQNDDVGTYTAVITNTSATDLTLTTHDIAISIGAGTSGACVSRALEDLDSRIDRVIFNDLDHTSSEEGDGICATYSDFTELSTDVVAGQAVGLGYTLGTCSGSFEKGVKVYIDWNQDGQFSEDEWIAGNLQSDTLATEHYFSEDFYTIPSDLSEGSYVLRLVLVETDDLVNITGCGEYDYGETEDYTINVVTGSTDSEPPVIALQSPPTTYALGSGSITISASITDNIGILTAGFFHGKITEISDPSDVDQYNVVIPEETTTGVYEHTLSSSDFDNVGLFYFFFAIDGAGNSSFSDPWPATISSEFGPGSLTINSVSPVSNTNDPQPTDYRIFSLPVRSATINSVFGVSTMDKEKFRIFRYNGSNSELTSSGSTLPPGNGFWLIYLNGEVDLDFGGQAVSATNDNPFTITLRSGINLIGNPYNFNISWAEVLSHNESAGTINAGDISGLTFYEGSFIDRGNTNLGVTQGAFVQSNEPVTIEIPLSSGTSRIATFKARKGSNPLDAESWNVPIDLEIKETSYKVASIGMKKQADEGRDKYDLLAMPYLQKYLEFNSMNPEFDQERISQDFVPTQENYIWEFQARSSFDPRQATLSWDNETFGNNDKQLILYDVEKDKAINMRERSWYSFPLGEQRKFRIYFGNESFLNEELKPRSIRLGNAYPNPFNSIATIPFSLPEGNTVYEVKVDIYNSTGQHVKRLVDSKMGSGFYEIQWNGTNEAGQVMSEGIYIYRLNVGHGNGRKDLNGKVILRK